jgi:hypothetical protein
MENKRQKPAAYDNSFLGIQGVTQATLFNSKGVAIGTCMDTPNNVAFAMATDLRISSASGLLGKRLRKDLAYKFKWIVKDADYHAKFVKMF